MENQPKISIVEAYFLIAFALIADFINWIPILNILTTIITLPALQFYLKAKGVRGTSGLIGNLLEFIPGLSILPGITGGVIATIIIDRIEARAGKYIEKTAAA